MVENIDQHRDDAKWLVRSLDDLLGPSTPTDTRHAEQSRLDDVLKRYKTLMPAIEVTSTRTSIIVR